MATRRFDPTLKALVEADPACWPALLGGPTGPTEVVDADIATVSGAADKVLRVSANPPYLLHLEFVSGHDSAVLPRRLLMHSGLLSDRHDLPVRSAIVLLRSGTDSPQLTGLYERGFPSEQPYVTFRYQVVRVWTLSPENLLTGPLGLVPLALISAVTETELPAIIRRIEKRLDESRSHERAEQLWVATFLLAGLRYPPELTEHLLRGVRSMRESSTYRAILEEGRQEGQAQEARRLLHRVGPQFLGPLDKRSAETIDGIADVDRLERLFDQLKTAKSWQELLGLAPRRRRSQR